MRNQIISTWKPLGINFYTRERLFEKKLDIKFPDFTYCEYTGLFILSEYPDLKFDNYTIFEEVDWKEITQKTIFYSLLSLLQKNKVEIFNYNDHFSFLYIINYKSSGYYLNKKSSDQDSDYLLDLITNAIETDISNHPSIQNNLKKVIKRVFDSFLGKTKEHNKPAKSFIKELLNGYGNYIPWFELKKEKKLLGISSKYFVDIDKENLEKVVSIFNSINKNSFIDKHKNIDKEELKEKIFKIIKNDLRTRKPSDDSGD